MKKAVFLDRDGTIIRDTGYPSKIKDIELISGVPEALRDLYEDGYLLVVVSNQSGVARGMFDDNTVEKLNRYLASQLEKEGVRIETFVWCSHHPDYTGECSCRKPSPGMILAVARALNIDLSASWTVGDKLSDIEAGTAAGSRTALVRTGYGAAEEKKLRSRDYNPDVVVDDLAGFAVSVLSGDLKGEGY